MDLAPKYVAGDGATNDRPSNVVEKARQNENEWQAKERPLRCRLFRVGFCAKDAVGLVFAESDNQGERNPRSSAAFFRERYYRHHETSRLPLG